MLHVPFPWKARGQSMTSHTDRHIVHLEYTFAASPHLGYRAWLEPDLVRQWVAPGDQEITRVEFDERPGGAYRTWKADAGVIEGGFDSELLELEPDKRLVFRWGFIGPERRAGPSFDTRLTITLHEREDGSTRLELLHEDLEELAAAMPHIARYVGPGWEAVFTKLERVLARDRDGSERATASPSHRV